METEVLNGHDLMNMLNTSLARLEALSGEIDALNVFPVPDGDTGTNMYLTLASAVREAEKAADVSSIGSVGDSASRGALMGARGNSGVILSQLLRGIALGLKNMDRVTGPVFAGALESGVKAAYRAIMKPVEGTILTVAREAAAESVKSAKSHAKAAEILTAACRKAEKSLNETPELLPALKEAGVVDAGGKGWLVILEGFRDGLSGQKRAVTKPGKAKTPAVQSSKPGRPSRPAAESKGSGLKFPYCTEVLINCGGIEKDSIRESLKLMGDCLLVVGADDIVRVHIHSAHPGNILETCLKYGPLSDIKVSNMNEQAEEAVGQERKATAAKQGEQPETAELEGRPSGKPFGIISVAAGEGLQNIMKNLGADWVVLGGQTMNPSTRELVDAVEGLNTGEVIVLPNNSNVILTARQVSELTSKKVTVVPSKTIPQGLAALIAVMPGGDAEGTAAAMNEAITSVKTGEITYAVRDTKVNGREITKGSIIGLSDGEIAGLGETVPETTESLLREIITEDDEVCTIYYGETVEATDAEKLLGRLEKEFSWIEFELHYGGQPLYYYIISVE